MRKKLVYGAMCIALSAMLVGCGKDTGDNGDVQSTKEQSTKEQSTVQESESSEETTSDGGSVVSDDSMGAWVLRNEITDKAVLDEPSGAALFPDKLTLPINIDSLMDYQVLAAGVDQGTLSSIVDSYTDSFTSLDFMILDKTGTVYAYMPDLILGKEDDSQETNIKQAISDGNWMLGPTAMYYDALGLTEDEYDNMCNENPDEDGKYLLMDKLYDMLGTPNYIGWFCDADNQTRPGETNDAKEFIDNMRNPENYGSDSVTAYSTYIGWQFADYGIVIYVSETSNSSSGTLKANIHDVSISYVPATYGKLEDVFGTNAVSDFIAAK
ncbi:MAG: hypothetical protein ACLRXD_02490 [Coprococcus sp.]